MPVLDRLAKARVELLFLLGAVVVALFAWTAYLSATLPPKHITQHWDLAWSGFDLFEAAALAGTVIALVRRSSLLPLLAAVAGTALLCDAWFDLITAAPGATYAGRSSRRSRPRFRSRRSASGSRSTRGVPCSAPREPR
jgi:hypothetical protein